MSGHHQLSVPEYKAHPQLLVFTGVKKSAPYTPELTVLAKSLSSCKISRQQFKMDVDVEQMEMKVQTSDPIGKWLGSVQHHSVLHLPPVGGQSAAVV